MPGVTVLSTRMPQLSIERTEPPLSDHRPPRYDRGRTAKAACKARQVTSSICSSTCCPKRFALAWTGGLPKSGTGKGQGRVQLWKWAHFGLPCRQDPPQRRRRRRVLRDFAGGQVRRPGPRGQPLVEGKQSRKMLEGKTADRPTGRRVRYRWLNRNGTCSSLRKGGKK